MTKEDATKPIEQINEEDKEFVLLDDEELDAATGGYKLLNPEALFELSKRKMAN